MNQVQQHTPVRVGKRLRTSITHSQMLAVDMTRAVLEKVLGRSPEWRRCDIFAEPIIGQDTPCPVRVLRIKGVVMEADGMADGDARVEATCKVEGQAPWMPHSVRLKVGSMVHHFIFKLPAEKFHLAFDGVGAYLPKEIGRKKAA